MWKHIRIEQKIKVSIKKLLFVVNFIWWAFTQTCTETRLMWKNCKLILSVFNILRIVIFVLTNQWFYSILFRNVLKLQAHELKKWQPLETWSEMSELRLCQTSGICFPDIKKSKHSIKLNITTCLDIKWKVLNWWIFYFLLRFPPESVNALKDGLRCLIQAL